MLNEQVKHTHSSSENEGEKEWASDTNYYYYNVWKQQSRIKKKIQNKMKWSELTAAEVAEKDTKRKKNHPKEIKIKITRKYRIMWVLFIHMEYISYKNTQHIS